MNREKLSEALENINLAYIESAGNYRKKQTPKMNLSKWSSLAACFAILMLASVLLIQNAIQADEVYWSESMTENAILEKRKISVINTPDYEHYISLKVIDPDYVGVKLEDTEIRSFWRNYLLNEDTDLELLRAEIYAINGISPDIAVCIRYLDEGDSLTTTHYYTYINTDHKPQDFKDFRHTFRADWELMSNDENSIKKSLTLSYPSENGSVYQICDIDGNLLFQSLTALVNTDVRDVRVFNDETFAKKEKNILNKCSAQAFFQSEALLCGIFHCRIYDNGYLYIRINENLSYLFEFSERETQDFFRLIDEYKNNYATYETVTAESTPVPE